SPELLWAQRDNEIYLTINVSDVVDPKIELKPDSIHFAGPSHGKLYEFKLDFYKEIDPESSRKNVTARSIVLIIAKKQGEYQYWPRLIKSSTKPHFLKTDFARWKDEDDDDDEDARGPGGGFDMSQFTGMGDMMGGMGGMGGLGGMGGMDGGFGG
ncbi:HSP20-like chaperone, partial [Zopfochytrium polystomum]